MNKSLSLFLTFSFLYISTGIFAKDGLEKENIVLKILMVILSGGAVLLLYIMLDYIIKQSKKKDKSKEQIINLSGLIILFILMILGTIFMIFSKWASPLWELFY